MHDLGRSVRGVGEGWVVLSVSSCGDWARLPLSCRVAVLPVSAVDRTRCKEAEKKKKSTTPGTGQSLEVLGLSQPRVGWLFGVTRGTVYRGPGGPAGVLSEDPCCDGCCMWGRQDPELWDKNNDGGEVHRG